MSHRLPPGDHRLTDAEPVMSAEGARLVLAAIAVASWIGLDSATASVIASVVAALASVGLSWWARRNVTPVAPVEQQP